MTQSEIYSAITERIIAEMEKGIIPWHKPWTGTNGGAVSGTTGKPYSILNQILLGKPGRWYTFNQIKKVGGNVRKGEHGSFVVFWKQIIVESKTEKDESGNPLKETIPILKHYYVFHESQCDNVPETDIPETFTHDPIEEAAKIEQEYAQREKLTINHVISDRAFYSPFTDEITVPVLEQFPVREEYYSTLYHEMIHSTGHKSRLNRLHRTAAFGSEEYSREELVAEIGAAALLHHVGIETADTFHNNAAYVQGWLKALKNDTKLLVGASGQAAKAFSFITGSETAENEEI